MLKSKKIRYTENGTFNIYILEFFMHHFSMSIADCISRIIVNYILFLDNSTIF